MASSKELADYGIFPFPEEAENENFPVIDSQFTCLLAVTGSDGDSLVVNESGLDSLLSRIGQDTPVLIHVCIGTDSTYNSSLISKLLGFTKTTTTSDGTTDESSQRIVQELSKVFSEHREEVSQQCIVAWAKPIIIDGSEGKRVAHIFLDIWGKFTKNDPVYTALAGIATAMANSVVHIVQNELEGATQSWLKQVSLVAMKATTSSFKQQLRSMTLVVTDWQDSVMTFRPGHEDGQRYLLHKQSPSGNTVDTKTTAFTIEKLFSEIKCFLLPKYTKSTEPTYKQQVSALLRLILEENTLIGTHEYVNAKKAIRTVLESLGGSLSSYTDFDVAELDCLAETNAPWEDMESHVKEIKPDAEDASIVSSVESISLLEKTSEESEEKDLLQLGDISLNLEDTVGIQAVEDDFFADWDVFGESLEFKLWPDGTNKCIREDAGDKKMSFKEFLAKQKQSDQHGNITENPTRQELTVLEETQEKFRSAEEILSNILCKTDPIKMFEEKLNNMKLPRFSFSQVICVPEEFMKKPAKKRSSMYDNAFNSEFKEKQFSPSTHALDSREWNAGYNEESAVKYSEVIEEVELVKVEVKSLLQPSVQSTLLEIVISLFEDIKLDQDDTFTADEVLSKALCLAQSDRNSNESSVVDEIRTQLNEAFHCINSYVDSMDKFLEKNIFFDGPEQLTTESQKIKIKSFSLYGNKLGRFFEVTPKKIAEAENMYKRLNDQIAEKETANIEFTENLAVTLYQDRVRVEDISSQEELSKLHGKWVKIAKEAFGKAYCGDSGKKSILDRPLLELGNKLTQIHEQNKKTMKEKLDSNKVMNNLVKKTASWYDVELGRATVQNPSISTHKQFEESSRNYQMDALKKFHNDLKSISSTEEVRSHLRLVMESELKKAYQSTKEKFQAKIAKLAGPSQATVRYGIAEEDFDEGTRDKIPAQVGVHFGFETLTAVSLVDGKPRTVYGPSPNTICFYSDTDNEVHIGETNTGSGYADVISLNDVFHHLDITKGLYVSNRRRPYRSEEIVALVLAHLHRIIGNALHTTAIAYVIAFPSCFNQNQREAMQLATQIAGLKAKIVRETCGLTSFFIQEMYQHLLKSPPTSLLLTILENEFDGSFDCVGHTIKSGSVTPKFLYGYNAPSWSYSDYLPSLPWRGDSNSKSKPALESLLKKLRKCDAVMSHSRVEIRIILYCSNANRNRNTEIIKRELSTVKVHVYSSADAVIAIGAALLAGYKFNPKFTSEWDRDHPKICLGGLEQGINHTENNFYRLKHRGSTMTSTAAVNSAETLQKFVSAQYEALAKEKARGKQLFLEKSHQIQDSIRDISEKDRVSQELSNLSREINDEGVSASRVREMMNRMERLF